MRGRCVAGLAAVLAAVLVAGVCGCTSVYEAKTTLHADGSVEREVLQPAEDTPAAARAGWARVKEVDAPPGSGIARRPYVSASGRFASADKVPDSLSRRPKDAENLGLPAGKLVRRYSRDDYVFVTVHRWTETLTDHVTFDSMRQGRDELLELGIELGGKIFDEVLGKEYDAAELVKWLRAEGKAWLGEASDFCFVTALALDKSLPLSADAAEPFADGLLAICARHGLVLQKDGKPLEKEEASRVTEAFMMNLITQKVRRRDNGAPADPATVKAWLEELNTDPDDEAVPKKVNRFKAAARKIIDAQYGGEEGLTKRAFPPFFKVAGVWWGDFGSTRRFNYTMKMPGVVVATNGEAMGDDRTRWVFEGKQAWPMGYTMSCRSLEAQDAVQQSLLKGKPLASRESLLQFIDLVRDGGASEALEECRKKKSMRPLYDLRASKKGTADAEHTVAAIDRLLALLNLPREAP